MNSEKIFLGIPEKCQRFGRVAFISRLATIDPSLAAKRRHSKHILLFPSLSYLFVISFFVLDRDLVLSNVPTKHLTILVGATNPWIENLVWFRIVDGSVLGLSNREIFDWDVHGTKNIGAGQVPKKSATKGPD